MWKGKGAGHPKPVWGKEEGASEQEWGRGGVCLLGPADLPHSSCSPCSTPLKRSHNALGREGKGTHKLGDDTGEAGRKGRGYVEKPRRANLTGLGSLEGALSSSSSTQPEAPLHPQEGLEVHSSQLSSPLLFCLQGPGGLGGRRQGQSRKTLDSLASQRWWYQKSNSSRSPMPSPPREPHTRR